MGEAEEQYQASSIFLQGENPRSSTNQCSRSAFFGSERLVKIELDAAQTLADLAQLALQQCDNPKGKFCRKWGRRPRKKVKIETSDTEKDKDVADPVEATSKFNASCSLMDQGDWRKQKIPRIVEKTIEKVERDIDMIKLENKYSPTLMSFCGSKSKSNLSEVEKEAKRMRRILANRESARQTIRRRQAFCEELTKRAADLSRDNESMKKEKDQIVKEYHSLKVANQLLKERISKTDRDTKTERTDGGGNVATEIFPVKASSLPDTNRRTNSPTVMVKIEQDLTSETVSAQQQTPRFMKFPFPIPNKPPFPPFSWPSIVCPLESKPTHLFPSPTEWNDTETANLSIPTNKQGMPLYIVPWPLFFSLADRMSVSNPLGSSILQEREKNSVGGAALKSGENSETVCSRQVNIKSENPELIERNIEEEKNTPSIPMPLALFPESSLKSEEVINPCSDSKEASSSSFDGFFKPLPERSPSHKMVEAVVVTAAEARKRRKELTKLKNFHNRLHRLNC